MPSCAKKSRHLARMPARPIAWRIVYKRPTAVNFTPSVRAPLKRRVPRIEYPAECSAPLRYDEQGLLARYVVRLVLVGGKPIRWAVALQVRRRDGRFRD